MEMSNKILNIAGRSIGLGLPPYIVAEVSANHNGSLSRALETIKAAKECGADAVKIQTYTPDTLTIDCDNSDFKIKGGLWDGYTLFELYQEAHTPYEWHEAIFKYANDLGITIFSTPFDESAVDLLEDLKVPAYKIASFEMTDLPLVKYVAEKGKPMIISTGMSNVEEILEVIETVKDAGCEDLILLHCISSYPAPVEQSNLLTISDMAKRFDVLTGLSDHTLGTTVAVASVALGACLIEKHFTLSRADKGPDSDFSLEPKELIELCTEARVAFSALGECGYSLKQAEKSSIAFRRSLYVVKDIKKGQSFTKDHIRRIRPGYGLPPKFQVSVIGKIAAMDIKRGEALKWEHIEN